MVAVPSKTVRLSVPAEATFARAVRMMAANLAVDCDMSVDDVEDVRMAAEEGFVYSCATKPGSCDIAFGLAHDQMSMDFSLGSSVPDPEESPDASLDLVELLLSAICDDFGVSEDGATLHLSKRVGAADAE